MAQHFKETQPEPTQAPKNPQTAPGEGVSDNTIASPELGYGMERIDFLDERTPEEQSSYPLGAPVGRLAHNEVAAISTERTFYVSDVPSPYLSSRQANEDVQVTRRRHSRISAIIVTILILATFGVGGWFIYSSVKQPPTPQVSQYETRTIEGGEYLESIDTTSLVKPVNEVGVTPDISGTIAEVYVENGTDVQEGDWLFRLENPTINDALNKAQEAMNSFNDEVAKKQEALDRANEAQSQAQAAVDKNANDQAAKLALESAKSEVQRAQTELDAANNNLWNMQSTFEQAQEQQQRLTVCAPISGKVSEIDAQASTSSSVSGTTHLCTISDTTQLSLVMEIPKSEEKRVKVGQEVRLSFPAIEDLQLTSSVASIDENDTALLATVLIEEPDERLTTGAVADASLVLKSIPDTLIVPAEALHTAENGSTHLNVLLDPSRGIVTDVQVKVLATDGTRAAVEADNIQADTAVVVSDLETE